MIGLVERAADVRARVRGWASEPWIPLVSGSIAVTVLSGQASIERFLPFLPPGWGEIRVWGTTFLVLLTIYAWPRQRPRLDDAGWTVVPLIALAAFMGARSLPQLPSGAARTYVVNAGLLAAQGVTIWVLARDERTVKAILWWFVLVTLVLFIAGAWGVGQHEFVRRGWAPFGTSTSLYRLMGLGLAAVLAISLSSRSSPGIPGWVAWAMATCAFAYAALATLGRVVPLALLGLLVWVSLGLAARSRYRVSVALIALVGITAAIAWVTMSGDFKMRYSRINLEFATGGQVANAPSHTPEFTGRLRLFSEALRIFKEHPVIGAGPEGYLVPDPRPTANQGHAPYRYPHNVVLEFLALGGAWGGGLVVLAILAPLVPALRAAARSDAAVALGGYLPFALVASMVSGDVYDFRLYWVVALLIPLVRRQPVDR